MLFISLIVQAYVRFTCNATNGTVTVEEDCDTAMCDSCKDRRERLAVPACFTVQHGGETESVTVNCANGKAVVNMYTFMPGVQAKCPIGTGARLEDADVHVSGQCEVDSHGHHEHSLVDHKHDDFHSNDHKDTNGHQKGKDIHNSHMQTSSAPQLLVPEDVFEDEKAKSVVSVVDSAPLQIGFGFHFIAICVSSLLTVL